MSSFWPPICLFLGGLVKYCYDGIAIEKRTKILRIALKQNDIDNILDYADMTGDYNPIHIDEEAAKKINLSMTVRGESLDDILLAIKSMTKISFSYESGSDLTHISFINN